MMLLKCCTQYTSIFEKLSSGHRTGKGVFISIPEKDNAKECSNYHTIALISHTSKVMLKILQARPQWYVNHEVPDVQAGFRKGREARDQIANICRFIEKAREFPQKSTSASLSMLKTLTVCITNNYGKFFKRGQYQTTLCVFCETCMQIKKHQLEPDMKQWTRSKLGNKYVKAVYCHPSYLIYMQSTSCDMWAG